MPSRLSASKSVIRCSCQSHQLKAFSGILSTACIQVEERFYLDTCNSHTHDVSRGSLPWILKTADTLLPRLAALAGGIAARVAANQLSSLTEDGVSPFLSRVLARMTDVFHRNSENMSIFMSVSMVQSYTKRTLIQYSSARWWAPIS